jgi:hypothetical protein
VPVGRPCAAPIPVDKGRAGHYRPDPLPIGDLVVMRMVLPPLKERRAIDRSLLAFFREEKLPEFNRAIGAICRFYKLRRPRVEWYEYLDWGRTVGRTYENGTIHLVHPENWKKGRKYNSERQWINAVYHEMGHYVYWSDAERKADTFAIRMVRNVANGKSPATRNNVAARNGSKGPRGCEERRAVA